MIYQKEVQTEERIRRLKQQREEEKKAAYIQGRRQGYRLGYDDGFHDGYGTAKHHFPRRVDTSALLLICWQIFPFSNKEEERIYEIHIWHLRLGEVLHLRFDELLQVIDVDGFKGCIGFFFGKGVNVNEKVSHAAVNF